MQPSNELVRSPTIGDFHIKKLKVPYSIPCWGPFFYFRMWWTVFVSALPAWESLEAWNKQYASEEFCGFRFSWDLWTLAGQSSSRCVTLLFQRSQLITRRVFVDNLPCKHDCMIENTSLNQDWLVFKTRHSCTKEKAQSPRRVRTLSAYSALCEDVTDLPTRTILRVRTRLSHKLE